MKKAQFLRLLILVLLLLVGSFLWWNPSYPVFRQGIGVLMGFLSLLWLLSLRIKDASIIDIFWGFGFVLVAWFYTWQMGLEETSLRNYCLLALISIWGLRLTIYLGIRNIGKPEDYRYAQWRKENGENWWWLSFFRVFALQGFLLWLISALYVPALSVKTGMGAFEYLGMLLWAIGLFFETVGDWQLMQFKKNPANKGKVLDQGLWRYTRHPNYFGDAMVWWGFFCFALAHPSGWQYFFGPLLMTFFLLKVSGVAMLEVALKKNKPGYAEYIRKTSAFFPWPPKD